MKIVVNGEIRDMDAPTSVNLLLEQLKIQPEIVAVELNEIVIPRAALAETILKEGDRIEIVRMVGGGQVDRIVF